MRSSIRSTTAIDLSQIASNRGKQSCSPKRHASSAVLPGKHSCFVLAFEVLLRVLSVNDISLLSFSSASTIGSSTASILSMTSALWYCQRTRVSRDEKVKATLDTPCQVLRWRWSEHWYRHWTAMM